MDNIQQLKQWIDGSDRIVFFGGAGVSTESGIPDFRSVDGLYNQKYDYPPETILSHSFFMANSPPRYIRMRAEEGSLYCGKTRRWKGRPSCSIR